MPRNIWDRLEDDRPPSPDRVGIALGWRILAVLAAVALVGAIVWGVKVAVSGVKGAGDVTQQNNSARNRIANQQHFETLYGDIKSYEVKLTQAQSDRDAHPGDQWYQTNLTGLVNECADAVTEYNADARKVLYADWRAVDLPYQIDPVSTCKPGVLTPSAAPAPNAS